MAGAGGVSNWDRERVATFAISWRCSHFSPLSSMLYPIAAWVPNSIRIYFVRFGQPAQPRRLFQRSSSLLNQIKSKIDYRKVASLARVAAMSQQPFHLHLMATGVIALAATLLWY